MAAVKIREAFMAALAPEDNDENAPASSNRKVAPKPANKLVDFATKKVVTVLLQFKEFWICVCVA